MPLVIRTGMVTIYGISDLNKFKKHYPDWKQKFNISMIFDELYKGLSERL